MRALNKSVIPKVTYYCVYNIGEKMLGKDKLLNAPFEGQEFHFIRAVPYQRRYLEELNECGFLCLLEIDRPDGTRLFAECKDITKHDVHLRITNENDLWLSEAGECRTILWFACTTPFDKTAPAEAVAVVQKAASFVGITDKPLFSNRILFNRNFRGAEEILDDDWWCATFLWDVFRMCGLSQRLADGKKFQDCHVIRDWGVENGLTVDKTEGRFGDIIVYQWDGEDLPTHIALVVGKRSDGSYLTLDGCTSELDNTFGGHVNYRVRAKDYDKNIIAVIRPQYQ